MTVLRPNNDIFFQYLSHIFNECIETAGFPNELKLANINPVCKKMIDLEKKIIDLLLFYLLCLKYLNVAFLIKFLKMLIYYQETKWATERVTTLNIH